MTSPLRAAWLGSWQVPWPLGRGRRWGDPRWALAAISQAWLLGGREGRWPRATWSARPPRGPWLEAAPTETGPLPDPTWISLLRHGSARVPAHVRPPGEDPVRTWAWEALREGHAEPWMALGSVLLSLEERRAWIPLLGAVDGTGRLHLPSCLAMLLPPWLLSLPEGWWPCLLGEMGPDGRLLPHPSGDPAPTLQRLRHLDLAALEPLVGTGPTPEGACTFPDGTWMVDPRLRGWARGWGASPQGLAPLCPADLAHGAGPDPATRSVLQGERPPLSLSEGWVEALAAEAEGRPVTTPPSPSGNPTLDRLRTRWVEELPGPWRGYPSWGEAAHPCADPFHWMAEGFRCFRLCQVEGALRAFGWAHHHFQRLRSPRWAQRAAANAWISAAHWADVEAMRAWGRLKGRAQSPQEEYEAAWEQAARGDHDAAIAATERLLKTHPDCVPALVLLGNLGVALDRPVLVQRAHSLVRLQNNNRLYAAYAGDLPEPVFDADGEECRLMWEAVKARRGLPAAPDLWETLEAHPNQLIRIDVALIVLEHRPGDRTPQRLLALQAIADRSCSPTRQARLRALWPSVPPSPSQAPEHLVRRWLADRPRPTWILVEDRLLGPATPPPEGLLGRLREAGQVTPVRMGDRVWWGDALRWNGGMAGAFLTSAPVEDPLPEDVDLHLLGPWLAALRPVAPQEPLPDNGPFPSDGSEPMASVLREAARVAPTPLPVLLLGASGTGKELMARAIHAWSGRPGNLIAVNCTAFAEGLLESELFGHVKGAFTGAERDRRGAIEMAEGGTLLLDEVADMSPRIQSMFLRVLQEREVRRVGGERTQRVDVRFLAATHKGLDALVAAGTFRHDLLYRLQGAVLRMPSLAERRHELPRLLPGMLAEAAAGLSRKAPPLTSGLPEALGRLPWPGNFRQLRHALERALLRCGSAPLGPEHFPELDVHQALQGTWESATAAFQRQLLASSLERHGWKVSEAARDLGLTRVALYAALRRLGVDLPAERHQHRLRAPRPLASTLS